MANLQVPPNCRELSKLLNLWIVKPKDTPGRRAISDLGPWDVMHDAFSWHIPDDFNIADQCCDMWAAHEPNRLAIRDIDQNGSSRDFTYDELAKASDAFASALAKAGVTKGDRVAVLLAQSAEVMIAHLATHKLGAIILPLFTLFGPDALAHGLGDSSARILVTDAENVAKLDGLSLSALEHIYLTDTSSSSNNRSFWGAIESELNKPFERTRTHADDPATLIYTSGTTGPAKGVLHAHRFLIGHLPSIETTHPNFGQNGDCGWTPADWAWIGGLMDLAIPCLYYGVPLIAHRMRKFDAEQAIAFIAKNQIRNLFLPPTALKQMRNANLPDTLRIRTISSGGESLGIGLLDWAKSSLNVSINEIYGQTECNLVLANVAEHMPEAKGTMGRAVPGAKVAIIDEVGDVVAPGVLGEIAVQRGHPVMFLRYWNAPKATEAKFVGKWLRTGDIGMMDQSGNITFAGRDDDIITTSGYRVGPTEIENCLLRHPEVLNAAIIGVPDPDRTEAIAAYVVTPSGLSRAEETKLAQKLTTAVRKNVGAHLVPRAFHFVDHLPMTTTGKIQRQILRNRAIERQDD